MIPCDKLIPSTLKILGTMDHDQNCTTDKEVLSRNGDHASLGASDIGSSSENVRARNLPDINPSHTSQLGADATLHVHHKHDECLSGTESDAEQIVQAHAVFLSRRREVAHALENGFSLISPRQTANVLKPLTKRESREGQNVPECREAHITNRHVQSTLSRRVPRKGEKSMLRDMKLEDKGLRETRTAPCNQHILGRTESPRDVDLFRNSVGLSNFQERTGDQIPLFTENIYASNAQDLMGEVEGTQNTSLGMFYTGVDSDCTPHGESFDPLRTPCQNIAIAETPQVVSKMNVRENKDNERTSKRENLSKLSTSTTSPHSSPGRSDQFLNSSDISEFILDTPSRQCWPAAKSEMGKIRKLPFDAPITDVEISNGGFGNIAKASRVAVRSTIQPKGILCNGSAILSDHIELISKDKRCRGRPRHEANESSHLSMQRKKRQKSITAKSSGDKHAKLQAEEMKLKRAIRNRESARRSRIKSKVKFQNMERRYAELSDENIGLTSLVDSLLSPTSKLPFKDRDET